MIDYNDIVNKEIKGVYIIKNLENNLIKIGRANNLKKRFKGILTTFRFCAKDDKLILVAFIEHDNNIELESYLHKQFKDYRVMGEWFNVDYKEVIIKSKDFKPSTSERKGFSYDLKDIRFVYDDLIEDDKVKSVMLLNNIFINSNNKESIIKELNSKYIGGILNYLAWKKDIEGISAFSVEDMIRSLGMKPNSHKGKINGKIFDTIIDLRDREYINKLIINKKHYNGFSSCMLNILSLNSNNTAYNYIKITDYEKNRIFTYDKQKIDKIMLFNLYCHLKARMYKRENNYSLSITGGKAQVCYPSYESIENDILIKPSTIKKYIDILSDIDLIRYDNAGTYIKDGNKYKSSNTYVLYDKDGEWKYELEQGIKFFKNLKENDGYKFI